MDKFRRHVTAAVGAPSLRSHVASGGAPASSVSSVSSVSSSPRGDASLQELVGRYKRAQETVGKLSDELAKAKSKIPMLTKATQISGAGIADRDRLKRGLEEVKETEMLLKAANRMAGQLSMEISEAGAREQPLKPRR